MADGTKLLTEQEAQGAWTATYSTHAKPFAEYLDDLRERGLIAPEPDPLLVEAREIAGKTLHRLGASAEQIAASEITSGKRDDAIIVHATLAALRRGIEIGQAERPELTREMVREAVIAAKPEMLETSDFILRETEGCRREAEAFIDRLRAALASEPGK